MLEYIDENGVKRSKVNNAIRYLQRFAPHDKFFLAFSGGKDSQCIYHLAKLAGVPFEAHYSITSVDPPELIYFIRDFYPNVSMDIPHDKDGNRVSMWSLIASHTLPPTRRVRYCCEHLKECAGIGMITVTGVRWAESANRKNSHGLVDFQNKPKTMQKLADKLGVAYKVNKKGGVILMDDTDQSVIMTHAVYPKVKTLLNPIYDWSESDVWEFLNDVVKVPHCSLYDEGFKRLGCIGCPLSGSKNMIRDFERWPKYKELYIRAFEKMIKNHPGKIKILDPNSDTNFPTRQGVGWFRWWTTYK